MNFFAFQALNPRKEVGLQAHKSKRKKPEAISDKILDEPPLDNETIFANFQVIHAVFMHCRMQYLTYFPCCNRLQSSGN
jgi:hypothetical protein